MRLLSVLWSVLPVVGLSSQVLAAPAPKSTKPVEKAHSHVASSAKDKKSTKDGKGAKLEKVAVRGKEASRGKDAARSGKEAPSRGKGHVATSDKRAPRLERASATRMEERVRVELSMRGSHGGEPSDAELLEWLSHGATKKSAPKGASIERAGARSGGAPKLEKSAAHKSSDKKHESDVKHDKARSKSEVESEKPAPKKGESEKPASKKAEQESEKAASKKSESIIKDEKRKTEAVCMGPVIDILRGTETDKVALTKCNGKADEQGVLRLSVMARPGQVARPVQVRREEDLGAAIKKVDPGLAERIATLSSHFATQKGPAAIEVISGYRPGSKGSYHSHARAMDIRVQGARNEDVVAFCKTLNDTGCGYYPNSGFVHVDVRDPGTGHISWIDASGPGETPRYVASWPPPKTTDKEETASSKAKSTREEKSTIDGESSESEASEKADKSEKAERTEDAKALPATKPESSMKPADKAKPESERDLPKLPPPASAD